MRLQVEGIAEVLDMFSRASNVERDIDKLRRDFAFGTEGRIKEAAPVSPGGGFLRSAVYGTTQGDEAVFVDYANYARYVDLGTGRRGGASYQRYLPFERPVAYATYWAGMEAQPFMRKPIAEGLDELERRIDEIAGDI